MTPVSTQPSILTKTDFITIVEKSIVEKIQKNDNKNLEIMKSMLNHLKQENKYNDGEFPRVKRRRLV